ncbi:MAG: cobyric acid synthase CobQ [Nitrospira sp. ST-bin5]|nr:MAG: cobyric acid synthase CobQ [Nitrospira sp. ST-bin5]
MVQGTASSAGKSLLVTALCRFFRREGLRVAPFKSQNMALNSAVTVDGLEIGRAQAVQAEASGILSCVDMNPILLKPEGDRRSQVVVLGKPIGSMTATEYHEYKPRLSTVIAASLTRLRTDYDLVVIEGAGSPAEINLKDRDIVNMHVAKLADAPVLLVGDIDRGGVFASFVGTMELLEPDERARVAAFVVNKFRGDLALLTPGLSFLTDRTGKPVLGVVPYIPDLRIADEDSVSLEARMSRRRPSRQELDIVVVRVPRISNYDDVEALEHEAGVVVRFVEQPDEVEGADLVILPGSKNTVADLTWLRASGIAGAIEARAREGQPVLGVCGGCQMLGEVIDDPHGVESAEVQVRGLGLLALRTRFEREKMTAQVLARVLRPSFLTDGAALDEEVRGYEIHMGMVEPKNRQASLFEIQSRNGRTEVRSDGAISGNGMVVGTMLHGLFENEVIRARTLSFLRRRKGLSEPASIQRIPSKQAEYDRLEAVVRAHIDCELLWRLTGLCSVSPR